MTSPRTPSTGLRLSVERRSAPVLTYLSTQPKLLVPALTALLLVCGLALSPVYGVICLLLLLALVGWLSYLSWPVVVGPARAVRLAVLALIASALVRRFLEF